MSIGSLQTTPRANPWNSASSSGANAAGSASSTSSTGISIPFQGSFGPAVPNGPWSRVGGGQPSPASASANPLQNLASDIQAMLIQAQTAAATASGTTTAASATASGTTSAASSGSASVTPEQAVANDLQSLLNNLQSSLSPKGQIANADPTGTTGQTEHHHHHHHREGGGDSNGATAVAGAATPSGTQVATPGAQSGGDQAVAGVFAADIAQALQAYGATALSASMMAVTT